MKQMRKFAVYVDDGRNVSKIAVPATSEKAARAYVAGNGEIVAIKDVTSEYPIEETAVYRALEAAGFGATEVCFMGRALYQMGIIEGTEGKA